MNKVLLVLVALLMPFMASADNYTSLWKQFKDAQNKDLPQTEIKVLSQIANKANQEKQYGQLLKAQLLKAAVQTTISPDSADTEIKRIESCENSTNDKVLKAVYASVLGKLYEDKSTGESSKVSRKWYEASLSDMSLLAKYKSTEYEPSVVKGINSNIFDNDLLHVIGMQAKEYAKLRDFYDRNGNRAAACICAAKALETSSPRYIAKAKGSKYLQQADSLINVYGDLSEAGELAILRYNAMEYAKDVKTDEKVNYIKYAIQRWNGWQRMDILKNALCNLQQPSFSINVGNSMLLPNAPRTVHIENIRNINEIHLNIYKVNANGNASLDPTTKKGYAAMKSLIVPKAVFTTSKSYTGLPAWKVVSDSMIVEGLPVGVYLIEATSNNTKIQTARDIIRVSNIFVINQALPDNKIRFAVVNATTGSPVSGAHINVYEASSNYAGRHKDRTVRILTTNNNGEVEYSFSKNNRVRTVYAYTDSDKACAEQNINSYYHYWNNGQKISNRIQAFTDRNVYRPGQTVHITTVSWTADKSFLSSKTASGLKVKFSLRDANNKEVSQKTATTDDYGTASVDFTLPQNGLTGFFHITASTESRSSSAYFRVEQYKRPTFQVTFDKYKDSYKSGDTINVRGIATTYSGVPVQGAKVAYTVTRRQNLWWSRYGQSTEMDNDSITTDDDGSFIIRVPMLMPVSEDQTKGNGNHKAQSYSFDINAQVTNGAGETREGSTSLPLSTRSAILTTDLPDKILRDSLKDITFACKNLTGEDIASSVRFRFDDSSWMMTHTQKSTIVSRLSSGLHHLEAICEGDTLKQDVVVFSMDDKQPATKTHDWYYLSAKQFNNNGNPVYIQVGSSNVNTQLYYTILSGNKIIEEGSKHISNEVVTRKLQYREIYGDGVTLTYAWVVNGILYTHYAQIKRPQPNTNLKFTWSTFRDKLTPGQKETWTLNIASPNNKPAKAQLLATMYDKSLDAIYSQMDWQLNNDFSFSLPMSNWNGGYNPTTYLNGFQHYTSLKEHNLSFSHFDTDLFGWNWPGINTRDEVYLGRGVRMYKHAQVMTMAMAAPMAAFADLSENTENSNHKSQIPTSNSQTVRENLNETAFFYPTLHTNKQGNVNISFTLPESITTWRFLGLAHDSLMNNCIITAEAVASKPVMVQPNMPRFLREGDKATISTIIFNTTDKQKKGNVHIVLTDPENDNVIMEQQQPFSILPNGSLTATFNVDAAQLAEKGKGQDLLIAKIYADGEGFSDGEQHYLPLLPNMEQVINTIPFYQNEAGVKDVDLTKIFPTDSNNKRLTVEYTNNPAWLVIQALPTLASPYQQDAASLSAAIYANIIGREILTSSPRIAQIIKLWQQEEGKETSLTSNLAKDEDLKNIVLSETPWVSDAEHETDQKQQLAQYLDESTINFRVNDFTTKLRKLQNTDGSFSWWPGMPGNEYMTINVVETLTRLNKIAGNQATLSSILNNAFTYLKGKIAKEVVELKKQEKKDTKELQPSEVACHYLYSAALDGHKETADMTYLVNLLDKQQAQLTIYGKACTAVILAQYGKTAHAKTLLESIRQYTVYKDEMGRYFDTPKARYSWMDYRIPTQTAAIEALSLLDHSDTVTIQQMQRWLLHEKHTTSWSTSINAVNAVYAFLGISTFGSSEGNNHEVLPLSNSGNATLKLDGMTLEMSKATAGIGYVKVSTDVTDPHKLTIDKTSNGTSWGAVYGQFLQRVNNVSSSASGLSIKREIYINNAPDDHKNRTIENLEVGQKITVRIIITADRDYDFVQVQDKRAACLEPVSQISGYRWARNGGYYVAPQDNVTNYYFDRLPKGTQIIETQYFVDRTGDYTSGICTIQCAYSPEFSGREAGHTINVK